VAHAEDSTTHSAACWNWHPQCANQRIVAVLELHAPQPAMDDPESEDPIHLWCNHCGLIGDADVWENIEWPCATVRALNGTK
jgi:hypothetical protein